MSVCKSGSRGVARPCIKLSKRCLSSRHSRVSEPREGSLDGEQLPSLGLFHPLALSPPPSRCLHHSAAAALTLWSFNSLVKIVTEKLPIQSGACCTSKAALLYLHLATVTSSNKSTDMSGLAPELQRRQNNGRLLDLIHHSCTFSTLSACFQGPMAATFTQRRKRRPSWILVEQT